MSGIIHKLIYLDLTKEIGIRPNLVDYKQRTVVYIYVLIKPQSTSLLIRIVVINNFAHPLYFALIIYNKKFKCFLLKQAYTVLNCN
jgi:hypothetical protein